MISDLENNPSEYLEELMMSTVLTKGNHLILLLLIENAKQVIMVQEA